MQTDDEQLISKVRDALLSGRLGLDDLTARRIGALAGKTTGLLYHHWGSVDGFLFAVSESGMALLGTRLAEAAATGAELPELAAAFVRFGIEAGPLYQLMFERRHDWAALRKAGKLTPELPGVRLFAVLVERFARAGARDPKRDARMLFAGLHGLVSLAISGRANIGDRQITDEEAALSAARELTLRICTEPERNRHADDLRSARPAQRRRAEKSHRQVRDERAPRRPRRRSQ
jgi:AcrR family transcriptional regulator